MIGIFGGTFDPIHFGHLRPALEIAEALSLQEVRFMPASLPPLKATPYTPAEHRLEMVRQAIATEPRFTLDARELRRLGPSWTVDTLQELTGESPDETFVFILGADAFTRFRQWKDWQTILQQVHLVVSHRPGHEIDRNGWPTEVWAEDVQSLHQHRAGKILPIAVTQLEISSTFIRACVHNAQSIQFLVPERVDQYIKENHLYHSEDNISITESG